MPKSPSIPPDAVHYQLTREQIVGQWFRLRMFQPMKFGVYGIVFLCGAVMLYSQGPKAYLGWVFAGFPFLFALIYYGGLRNVVNQHPEMVGPRTLSFDEDGMVFAGTETRTEYPWNRIRKLTQNGAYFHLHLDSHGSAVTVPKAAFTPEQQERFLALAKGIGT